MYNSNRYPPNWRSLARACKERANWQCEECYVTQGTERISHRTGAVYRVYLHAAHTTLHDTTNQQPELQALCPTCHGKRDWQLRKLEVEETREMRKHQLLLSSRR
jgi:Zn finger protein HypA/HybF involved in hydrogenase expression